MAETQLTRETYDRLHAELEDLRTRGRVDIARAIEAARALGDLKENGDYHAAKDSQGKMEVADPPARRPRSTVPLSSTARPSAPGGS